MAEKKKKSAVKKPKENSLAKGKGLFDHINHLREVQDPRYVDTLTAEDLKSWSNYMICRFLSMQPELIETINEIQFYTFLPPREFYRICIDVVPRGRAFFPYVKSKSDKWNEDLIELLRSHFQESEVNVLEYLEILPTEEVRQIVSLYGFTEKQVEKMIKPEVKK